MYCFSVCVRYEQYVEDAYVAFLKQKGQAEQVSTITSTPVRLEYISITRGFGKSLIWVRCLIKQIH